MRLQFAAVVFLSQLAVAEGAFVVSPVAGPLNSGTVFPFLVTTNSAPSVRFQQVYSGADFVGHGAPQFLITELSFESALTSEINVLLQDIEISFSTTPRIPDGLSGTFADNVGADDQVVYSGPLHFYYAPGEPNWALHIPLQQPFLYDYGTGNLLLDVRNFQTVPPYYQFRGLAALDYVGDRASMIAAYDVSRPDADYVSSLGLQTRFTVTPVPEPSSVLLLLAALTGLACGCALRRRRRSNASASPVEANHVKGGPRWL